MILTALISLSAALLPAVPPPIHLSAETAALSGSTFHPFQKTAAQTPGAGYAGDFIPNGAKITWTVPNAPAGLYAVRVRYSAPFGSKGYDLVVNGVKFSGTLPATTADTFVSLRAGRIELAAGTNTVSIERGWGYYRIAAVDLSPAPPAPALQKPTQGLSDKQATLTARALFAALKRNYGVRTLSGQQNTEDIAYIENATGQSPAVEGGDFIEYSPSRVAHGSKPGGTIEKVIRDAQAGKVVTMLWHWNAPADLIDGSYTGKDGKPVAAPWWRGFYTEASTFDYAAALNDPRSPKYALLLRDIDAIAVQMKKFDAAGVPVLWRPLHEAEGGWFWWGSKGPESYKKLWRLLHDRLVNTHHLHNLVWVYSSGTDPKWYPGDDVVDIVGIDQYPSDTGDPLYNVYETLLSEYSRRKMLALTEFGGVPDLAKMRRYGVRWSYYMSWIGDLGPRKLDKATLTRLYTAPEIVNTAQAPAFLGAKR